MAYEESLAEAVIVLQAHRTIYSTELIVRVHGVAWGELPQSFRADMYLFVWLSF